MARVCNENENSFREIFTLLAKFRFNVFCKKMRNFREIGNAKISQKSENSSKKTKNASTPMVFMKFRFVFAFFASFIFAKTAKFREKVCEIFEM